MGEHATAGSIGDDFSASETPERRFHYFKSADVGARALETAQAAPDVDEAYDNRLNHARQAIIERFPQAGGTNMERIHGYFDSLGLQTPPLLVLDMSQQSEFDAFVTEASGRPPTSDKGQSNSSYENIFEFAVVFHDPDVEQVNGTEYTEGIIVHELAHGSSQHSDVHIAGKDYSSPPTIYETRSSQRAPMGRQDGFQSHVGGFMREAVAEQVRAKYVTDVLGMEMECLCRSSPIQTSEALLVTR